CLPRLQSRSSRAVARRARSRGVRGASCHGAGGVPSGAMPGDDEPAETGLSQVSGRFLQVQTTTDSRAEAVELARGAVEARLAACAQVTGPIASTYWWEEQVERAEEWQLILKLPTDRYAELAVYLTERHSYDEPEIVATPIITGSPGYL